MLDYPPNTDIELNDLPDAIRPNSEVREQSLSEALAIFRPFSIFKVKSNIVAAVDKGWFKVIVYLNDGKGGKIISVAEVITDNSLHLHLVFTPQPGSTREMGDRDGAYTHTVGYSRYCTVHSHCRLLQVLYCTLTLSATPGTVQYTHTVGYSRY